MNTRAIIHLASMSMLAMFACLPTTAQEAFFIYRNDGDFDGFFYDEVKRMSYSKLDLDSVEHDTWVVQEVETTDSLYRIPLTSIDSVGFQQPEIKLNPRLKYLDELGISDYVTKVERSSSPTIIYFDKSIPPELEPQLDDIVVSFYNPKYKKYSWIADEDFEGFAEKVTYVKRRYDDNSLWYIATDPITEISDIFVQLVSIEEVSMDDEGNVRRRMAGFNSESSPRKVTGGSSRLSLINFNGTFHREYSPNEKVKIGIDAGVGLKVDLRMAYQISTSRIFVKTALDTNVSLSPSLSLKSSSDFEATVDGIPKVIKSIKFPHIAPLFQTRPFPDIFVRGAGELSAAVKLPEANFNWSQVFTFDTDRFPMMMSYNGHANGPDGKNNDIFDLDVSKTDVQLSLSGFVQTGVKLSANIETNDWVEKIFSSSIGIDLYSGPKLEGNLNFSLSGLKDDGAYGMLKNSYIKAHVLSCDLEAKAELKTLWRDPEKKTFFDKSFQFGTMEFLVFPRFNKTSAIYNTKTGDLNATAFPSGMTLLPTKVGLKLYDNKGDLVEKAPSKMFFLGGVNHNFEYPFSGLPCGRYVVRPYIEIADIEIPVSDDYLACEAIVTPILDLRQDEEDVSASGADLSYTFITNDPNVQVSGGDSWINASVDDVDIHERFATLNIKVKENNTPFKRKAYIILIAGTGSITSRDTLIVNQDADKLFTYADVVVNYTYHKRTTNGWDDTSGTQTTMTEGPGSMGGFVKLSCTRNEDIITCRGTHDWDLSVPYHFDPDLSLITNTGGSSSGYKKWRFNFSVDVSDPNHPVIMGGSLNYIYDYTMQYIETRWYTTGSQQAGEIFYKRVDDVYIHDENSANWSHEIPYVGSVNNPWEYMSFEGKKLDYQPNQCMVFRLSGPQNVTMSASGRSTDKNDMVIGEDSYVPSWDRRASYTESEFQMGDDAYIEIKLAY